MYNHTGHPIIVWIGVSPFERPFTVWINFSGLFPLDRLPAAITIQASPTTKDPEDCFMSETIEDVKTVISDVLKIDTKDVKPETRFIEDLKADSMDQFFLIDGFCEKFDIAISDEDARQIKTVGDAVTFVDAAKK
jgi:acyl carrier protein